MTTALVLYDPGYPRSYVIGVSLARGFKTRGWKTRLSRIWNGAVQENVVAAYGWIWEDAFKAHENYFYVDLGWWKRRPHPHRISGHHRITMNNRYENLDPLVEWPHDRLKSLGVHLKPWRPGPVRRVLVAGMSKKSALTSGLGDKGWDLMAARALVKEGYQVVYRPKPGRKPSPLMEDIVCSDPQVETIEQAQDGVDAVYTHHSNVAVDALIAGIPAFQETNVTGPFGFKPGIDWYEEPKNRLTHLRGLAHRQWTPSEIETGSWLKSYLP